MIIFDKVSKKYKKVAVNNFSFKINDGEFIGLLGPNGAGKTTIIKMLCGLATFTSGTITINNNSLIDKRINYLSQIGVMPQHINLDNELTVNENLVLHGRLYKMRSNDIKRKINELLEFVDLTNQKNDFVSTLSGGMKRKLLLARCLMHNPSILLLDEPTIGLDVFYRHKIWELLKELHRNKTTILLTTHYLEEAESLCDKIVLLKNGSLLMSGTSDQFRKKVGKVVLEKYLQNKITLSFYKDQKTAIKAASKVKGKINIRNTKLEDAFIQLTGYKDD